MGLFDNSNVTIYAPRGQKTFYRHPGGTSASASVPSAPATPSTSSTPSTPPESSTNVFWAGIEKIKNVFDAIVAWFRPAREWVASDASVVELTRCHSNSDVFDPDDSDGWSSLSAARPMTPDDSTDPGHRPRMSTPVGSGRSSVSSVTSDASYVSVSSGERQGRRSPATDVYDYVDMRGWPSPGLPATEVQRGVEYVNAALAHRYANVDPVHVTRVWIPGPTSDSHAADPSGPNRLDDAASESFAPVLNPAPSPRQSLTMRAAEPSDATPTPLPRCLNRAASGHASDAEGPDQAAIEQARLDFFERNVLKSARLVVDVLKQFDRDAGAPSGDRHATRRTPGDFDVRQPVDKEKAATELMDIMERQAKITVDDIMLVYQQSGAMRPNIAPIPSPRLGRSSA